MTLVRLTASLAAGALLASGALAQDVIRIGYPLPITGPLSPEAKKLQNGANLWAEAQNKAGGIKVGAKRVKVEIVYVDYQSNTPRAVQATERLITQDKVHFLFSPFGSGATKAASSPKKLCVGVQTAEDPHGLNRQWQQPETRLALLMLQGQG